jgi:uncharacterized repeat protein (TIGR02543 family)
MIMGSNTNRIISLLVVSLSLLAACKNPFFATILGPEEKSSQKTWSYTVTFDKNGGDTEAVPAAKIVANPAVSVGALPSPPSRAGFEFAGWNTKADGSGTAFTAAATVNGNITVYAQWTDLSAGIQAEVDDFKENEAVKEALKTDAEEIGLDISGEDLAEIEAGITEALKAYEDLPEEAKEALTEQKAKLDTVKEKIETVKSALDFKETYGEILGNDPDTVESLADAEALLPNLEQALQDINDLPDAVKELLAEEIERLETLKEKVEEIAEENADEEDRAAAAEFRETHGEILGKTTGTVSPEDEDAVNTALLAYSGLDTAVQILLLEEYELLTDLKARIEILKTVYTITYHLNNGTGAETNPESYTAADLPLTLAVPSRTGYTFAGWYNNADFSGSAETGIPLDGTGNKDFYARWQAVTYTVVYNTNGGTGGSTPSSTHTYGQSKPLTLNGFTRTGYTFTGWNTDAGGGGTGYTNGQSVSNLSAVSGATITLYAQWQHPSVSLRVELQPVPDNPVLSSEELFADQSANFSVATEYAMYQWYWDGEAISGATAAAYTLAAGQTPGIYELSVKVTTGDAMLSARCRVVIKAK